MANLEFSSGVELPERVNSLLSVYTRRNALSLLFTDTTTPSLHDYFNEYMSTDAALAQPLTTYITSTYYNITVPPLPLISLFSTVITGNAGFLKSEITGYLQ